MPEVSLVPLAQERYVSDWLRGVLGLSLLLAEGFWVRGTGVWTFVPFGGTANLQSLIGWLFAFLVFSSCALIPRWRSCSLQPLPEKIAPRWLPLAGHCLSFGAFATLTLALATPRPGTDRYLVLLWFVLAAVSLVALGAATLPTRFLQLWTRRALLAGCAMTVASLLLFRVLQSFWLDGSAFTIWGVQWLLRVLGYHVTSAGNVVGTERFKVQILMYCSGYEGVGLFLVFSIAWLVWFRKEYRFPAALLLVPAGVVVSLSLNVLRIAGLILIGHYGHPKIATGGFHSQAGWIAFTLLAVGFCALSYQIPGMRSASAAAAGARAANDDPAAAYLGPFVAIQAAALISTAASAGFEWLYPLRVLAPAAVLLWYWKDYARVRLRPGIAVYAGAIGIAVSALWAGVAWHAAPNTGASEQLAALAAPWRAAWWFFRFAGAVVVAPLAEELAFRGYLMRRLRSPEVDKVDPASAGWVGLALSSLAFGLLHGGRWMEGVVAGALYGHVYTKRGKLGDAILAHAVTNLVLMLAVFYTGDWRFW